MGGKPRKHIGKAIGILIYFQKLYKIQNRQRQYNNNVTQRFAVFLKNVIYCTTLDYMKYIKLYV